jgi:uncharacterized protein
MGHEGISIGAVVAPNVLPPRLNQRAITAVMVLSLGFATATCHGAGFDCSRAASAIERQICADPDLSRLDADLAAAYKEAATTASDRGALGYDQRQWLRERNRCREAACLKTAYRNRIGELRAWNTADPAPRDLYGNYVVQRDYSIFNPETRKDEPVKTEDCLTLSRTKKPGLAFDLSLIGANGHSCSVQGTANPVAFGYEFRPAPATEADAPADCVLRMAINRGAIVLQDVGGACRTFYCGMRASIDGTQFPWQRKSAKGCAGPN